MVICAYQFLRYGVALDLKSHRAHSRVTWMPVIPDAGPTSWPEFGRGFVLRAEICHSTRLHTRPSTKDAPRRRHSAARHVMPPTEPKQAMSAPTSPRVTRARSQRARQRSPSTEHRIVPDTRPSHRAVTGQQGPETVPTMPRKLAASAGARPDLGQSRHTCQQWQGPESAPSRRSRPRALRFPECARTRATRPGRGGTGRPGDNGGNSQDAFG